MTSCNNGSSNENVTSTPSFDEQCLADESFNADLLPNMQRMLLAGEVLRPETVRLAQRRFPGLRVFNGYGPTESTDLVTLYKNAGGINKREQETIVAAPRGQAFFMYGPVARSTIRIETSNDIRQVFE